MREISINMSEAVDGVLSHHIAVSAGESLTACVVLLGDISEHIQLNITCDVAADASLLLCYAPTHALNEQWVINQAARSEFVRAVKRLGDKQMQVESQLHFNGEHARCGLHGFYRAEGAAKFSQAIHAYHNASNCQSLQHYRGTLSGQSQAAFESQVSVAPGVTGSSAMQQSHTLLLSKKAAITAKPALTIDNDDVVCSHGATVGQLNQQALFYMRARGLPDAVARGMLMQAFSATVFQEIESECVKEWALEGL